MEKKLGRLGVIGIPVVGVVLALVLVASFLNPRAGRIRAQSLELAEVHLVSVHRELDRSGAPGEAERRGVRLDHPCFVGGAPGPGAPPVEVESVAGLAPAFPVVGKSTPFRRRRG